MHDLCSVFGVLLLQTVFIGNLKTFSPTWKGGIIFFFGGGGGESAWLHKKRSAVHKLKGILPASLSGFLITVHLLCGCQP